MELDDTCKTIEILNADLEAQQLQTEEYFASYNKEKNKCAQLQKKSQATNKAMERARKDIKTMKIQINAQKAELKKAKKSKQNIPKNQFQANLAFNLKNNGNKSKEVKAKDILIGELRKQIKEFTRKEEELEQMLESALDNNHMLSHKSFVFEAQCNDMANQYDEQCEIVQRLRKDNEILKIEVQRQAEAVLE